jgi:hypothetical protein
MPSQDNIPNGGPQSAHPTEILSLAEVANQLSPAGDISSSPEPEVVFVKNKKSLSRHRKNARSQPTVVRPSRRVLNLQK